MTLFLSDNFLDLGPEIDLITVPRLKECRLRDVSQGTINWQVSTLCFLKFTIFDILLLSLRSVRHP